MAVVDGGVADGAKQRQVGRDRAGGQALAGHVALPGGDGVGVELGEGEVAEAGEDPGGELALGAVGGAGWAVSRRATRSW